MSLATRCASCGTVFRVVQDQLKVCEGWVRCGQCNEVFNALEALFDLERDPPPDWSPGSDLPVATAIGHSGKGSTLPSRFETTAVLPPKELPAPEHDRPLAHEPQHEPEPESLPASNAEHDPWAAVEATRLAAPPDDSNGSAYPSLPDDSPGFVREAKKRERWQEPRVRIPLILLGLLLTVALIAQVGHQFRDFVSARWPVTRPALLAWCEALHCTLEAPKRIEDIFVESSTLNRGDAPGTFRLTVALRNRSGMALALPAIELSLTDATGQLLARRILLAHDFRVASTVLNAGSESNLQLLLDTGAAKVSGYTVEIFYP